MFSFVHILCFPNPSLAWQDSSKFPLVSHHRFSPTIHEKKYFSAGFGGGKRLCNLYWALHPSRLEFEDTYVKLKLVLVQQMHNECNSYLLCKQSGFDSHSSIEHSIIFYLYFWSKGGRKELDPIISSCQFQHFRNADTKNYSQPCHLCMQRKNQECHKNYVFLVRAKQ